MEDDLSQCDIILLSVSIGYVSVFKPKKVAQGNQRVISDGLARVPNLGTEESGCNSYIVK